jgi:hypothetical protein
MPETKKYCTPLPEGLPGVPDPNDTTPSEIESKDLLDNILKDDSVGGPDEPEWEYLSKDSDGPEFEDGPEVPGWEERSKDTEFGITDESTPQPTCEANPKSIGCKVLGDQFIYAIQGLIADLESIKPPGYVLAVGKLKGAIIKLQAGN